MLTVSNISKRYRPLDPPVLQDVSFTVNAGERVGLVGPNGAGKSTLLHIITGQLQPDSGSVQIHPPDVRVGYLPQGLTAPDETPIRQVLYPRLAALYKAEAELARLGEALSSAAADEMDALLATYGDTLARVERLSQHIPQGDGEALLAGLGLDAIPLDTPLGQLSGGQKTRLGLAALLVDDPQLLILDEPTNHLDISALTWLENWLADFAGGVLLVSHDRTFLDNCVTAILALDEITHTTTLYPGTYRDYVEAVQHARDKQWAAWHDQQAEIARRQADIQRTMARAVRKENATTDSTQRRYAKKVARRAKAKETRLQRYLASEDRVEKPAQTWSLKLDFGELPTPGKDVLFLDNLAVGYDAALLSDLTLSVRSGERVVVTGPNGHGKSTLLKTIVGQLPPLAGQVRVGSSVQIGYLAQEQDTLDPRHTVLETLLAEAALSHTEARSFLHYFLFSGDDVFRRIENLSYGERTRLMLAVLVARGANLLVLDEPTNHLDVPSRELFEQALASFQGSVIAVVHDRYFVDKFAHTIWQVKDGQVAVEIAALLGQ